jgi:hypothetical protein
MGYQTNYELNFPHNDLSISTEIEAALDSITGYTWDSSFEQREVKWYGHEEDMRVISKLHPTILFELTGEGEEYPDLWKKYFKDGKMQFVRAEVTYGDFDEDKLK